MTAQPDYFDNEQVPASVPLWREAYIGVDWLRLRYSPVYYGLGVPRGDGSAVIVVPGFLASDIYLQELNFWLHRVGYKGYLSNIGRNADCLEVLTEKLTRTVEKAYAETGNKVHLVGHSLGGLLSVIVAQGNPDKVASVITMGSPFRGISSHPLVLQMGDRVRDRLTFTRNRKANCFTSACSCEARRALQSPLPASIPLSAIYTKTDGIVDWHKCITDNAMDNFEVSGTHGGLAFNPAVYRIIGNHLAGKGRIARKKQVS